MSNSMIELLFRQIFSSLCPGRPREPSAVPQMIFLSGAAFFAPCSPVPWGATEPKLPAERSARVISREIAPASPLKSASRASGASFATHPPFSSPWELWDKGRNGQRDFRGSRPPRRWRPEAPGQAPPNGNVSRPTYPRAPLHAIYG